MKKTVIILAATMIINLCLTGCEGKKIEKIEKITPVEVSRTDLIEFVSSFSVPGEVRAVNSAYVSPKIPGVIKDIMVSEGDRVIKDKTQLFEIDSETMAKNLKKAEQGLVLARLSVEESRANLDRLNAEYDKALNDYKRHKSLFEKKAISESAYDDVFTNYKKSEAMLKHGKTLLALAEANTTQADIEYSIIKQNFEDSIVTSPINGIVTQKNMEIGETGAPGAPILKIVDTEDVEVKGFVPSIYFDDIEENKTEVEIKYDNIDLGVYRVEYKSSIIDPVTRTFEVRCRLKGDNKYIVPGNLLSLNIIFEKRKNPGISENAVIVRNGKKIVFIENNNVVKQVDITTGLVRNGIVEILDSEKFKDKKIVVKGQTLITDGQKVMVREED